MSVQTDPVLVLPVLPIKEDKAIQVPQDYEDMRAVASDHTYMLQHSIVEVTLSFETEKPASLELDPGPSHGNGQLVTSTPIKVAQAVDRYSKPSCSGVAPLPLSDSDAEEDAEPSFVEKDALDVTYIPEVPRKQSSWGQHGAHLGPVGPTLPPWTLLSGLIPSTWWTSQGTQQS